MGKQVSECGWAGLYRGSKQCHSPLVLLFLHPLHVHPHPLVLVLVIRHDLLLLLLLLLLPVVVVAWVVGGLVRHSGQVGMCIGTERRKQEDGERPLPVAAGVFVVPHPPTTVNRKRCWLAERFLRRSISI